MEQTIMTRRNAGFITGSLKQMPIEDLERALESRKEYDAMLRQVLEEKKQEAKKP